MPFDLDRIQSLLMDAEVAYAARFPNTPATPRLGLEVDAAGVRVTRKAGDGMDCTFMQAATKPISAITEVAARAYAEIPAEALPMRIEFEICREGDCVNPVALSVAGFRLETRLIARRLAAVIDAFRAMVGEIGEAGRTPSRWAVLTRLPASSRYGFAGEIHAATARGAMLKYLVCHLGCDSPERIAHVSELHADLIARTHVARLDTLPGDRLLAVADRDKVA